MAFDACMMRAVLSEFRREFPEAKIEKVLQPRNDEIDMLIHHVRSSKRLVFNVGPNAPRLQTSEKQKENPLKAPMFCMLLRKYFVGARIVSVAQPGFDRIAEFTVACYDEMGFPAERRLICENSAFADPGSDYHTGSGADLLPRFCIGPDCQNAWLDYGSCCHWLWHQCPEQC